MKLVFEISIAIFVFFVLVFLTILTLIGCVLNKLGRKIKIGVDKIVKSE